MLKKSGIFIFILLLITLTISGCTTNKKATNGTFGERTVSINNIQIVNNVTAEHKEYNGTNYYFIRGYVKNNNRYDAFNLKMKAIVFDENGTVVTENETFILDPKVIPAGGDAFFSFRFTDNDNRIVRYDLKLISITTKA